MRIDELDQIVTQIDEDASAGLSDAVWTRVEPLLRDQQGNEDGALALVPIVQRGHLSVDKALTVLTEVYAAYSRNESVLGPLAGALEKARDIDLLNDVPPENPLFLNVVSTLIELSDTAKGGGAEPCTSSATLPSNMAAMRRPAGYPRSISCIQAGISRAPCSTRQTSMHSFVST